VISLELIHKKVEEAVPGARVELITNPAVEAQSALWVDREHAVAVATFLRDDPALRFDYASNVTGVEHLEEVQRDKIRVRRLVDGVERDFEDVIEIRRSAHLEVVYHLYSVALRHGPLVLRTRTDGRDALTVLPSLTPVWRSCELQEREIFDLFGIRFEGHPDLRRLLMWEEFCDYPMRRDYVDPDDYEYEPMPHDAVLERVNARGSSGAKEEA